MTLGARGALIYGRPRGSSASEAARCEEIAAPAVPKAAVVDTVGAGDSFCGTLATSLALSAARAGATTLPARRTVLDEKLAGAVKRACSVASLSVQKNGAQESYPSCAALQDGFFDTC